MCSAIIGKIVRAHANREAPKPAAAPVTAWLSFVTLSAGAHPRVRRFTLWRYRLSDQLRVEVASSGQLVLSYWHSEAGAQAAARKVGTVAAGGWWPRGRSESVTGLMVTASH